MSSAHDDFLTTFTRHLSVGGTMREEIITELKTHLAEANAHDDPKKLLGDPSFLAQKYNRVHLYGLTNRWSFVKISLLLALLFELAGFWDQVWWPIKKSNEVFLNVGFQIQWALPLLAALLVGGLLSRIHKPARLIPELLIPPLLISLTVQVLRLTFFQDFGEGSTYTFETGSLAFFPSAGQYLGRLLGLPLYFLGFLLVPMMISYALFRGLALPARPSTARWRGEFYFFLGIFGLFVFFVWITLNSFNFQLIISFPGAILLTAIPAWLQFRRRKTSFRQDAKLLFPNHDDRALGEQRGHRT